jgi:hypothetical protein
VQTKFYLFISSLVVHQTDQYYFMPIREQNSTKALAGNHGMMIIE